MIAIYSWFSYFRFTDADQCNNPRCDPPWTEIDLRHKAEEADTAPFDQSRGYLRDAPLRNGTPHEPSREAPEKGLTPNEAADDPHRLARLYIGERCRHDDGLTLRFWREEWHR